jgi:hypothetical protein
VVCSPASAEFRSNQPPIEVKAGSVLVVAQVYQPNLLISEFNGPLTIADLGVLLPGIGGKGAGKLWQAFVEQNEQRTSNSKLQTSRSEGAEVGSQESETRRGDPFFIPTPGS